MKIIPFNKPLVTGKEVRYIHEVIQNRNFSGSGTFTEKCEVLLQQKLGAKKVLLTSSGTAALEIAAMLINIVPGDEVIMPSFTFSSTANAFVLRGARVVFIDICPDTMNMDVNLVRCAITPKTKAIVVMHYGGVGCEMEGVFHLAKKYDLFVIEDAAHALMGTYKSKFLGTFGLAGCFSFHESKNIHCGEGGALSLSDQKMIEKAEVIREKGTNRTDFFRGEVDEYVWMEMGSSYLLSELNAAFLYAQLEQVEEVTSDRVEKWNLYYELLTPLSKRGYIDLPGVQEGSNHNGHLFYIKVRDRKERNILMQWLEQRNIRTTFHYVPLHSSPAGKRFGRLSGEDRFTSVESGRLLRLPLYYRLESEDIKRIASDLFTFYQEHVNL